MKKAKPPIKGKKPALPAMTMPMDLKQDKKMMGKTPKKPGKK